LEERVEDVLRNYELELLRAYRVRGAYLLETRQGTYLYKSYHGTETRAGYEAAIQGCLEELHEMETQRVPSLDRPADTFARILQAAAPASGEAARDRALEQLLYHVGRWIYLVDAWDDLDTDRTAGVYNPIVQRFPDGEEAGRDYLRTTLRHSLNLARSAWALLPPGAWGGVVENILFLGLPLVEELVFTGRWKAVKKRKQ